jgi:hypothetical protein
VVDRLCGSTAPFSLIADPKSGILNRKGAKDAFAFFVFFAFFAVQLLFLG